MTKYTKMLILMQSGTVFLIFFMFCCVSGNDCFSRSNKKLKNKFTFVYCLEKYESNEHSFLDVFLGFLMFFYDFSYFHSFRVKIIQKMPKFVKFTS